MDQRDALKFVHLFILLFFTLNMFFHYKALYVVVHAGEYMHKAVHATGNLLRCRDRFNFSSSPLGALLMFYFRQGQGHVIHHVTGCLRRLAVRCVFGRTKPWTQQDLLSQSSDQDREKHIVKTSILDFQRTKMVLPVSFSKDKAALI